MPFYGKLSDQFGRKPMFMFGISVFLIGSALSGLSQNMEQLILFRGIQGLGAGALFPISLAVIGDLFSPAERGKYQGLFGAVFGIASLVGPALGGFLTDKSAGTGSSTSTSRSGSSRCTSSGACCRRSSPTGATRKIDYLGGAVFTVAIVRS